MFSTKLSVSIHILSVIALSEEKPITSEYISQSINTNPVFVRRLMSKLKKANLIESSPRLGAIGVAKPLDKISLLDVFKAVEDEQRVFNIHTDTNHKCPVGAKIEDTLTSVYKNILISMEEKLSEISLSDILSKLKL